MDIGPNNFKDLLRSKEVYVILEFNNFLNGVNELTGLNELSGLNELNRNAPRIIGAFFSYHQAQKYLGPNRIIKGPVPLLDDYDGHYPRHYPPYVFPDKPFGRPPSPPLPNIYPFNPFSPELPTKPNFPQFKMDE
jgi:hypothetical protein